MALISNITLEVYNTEVVLPNAYHKICRINGNQDEMYIEITAYTDQTKTKEIIKKTFLFVPNLEGKNFIAQSYDYLKTLPEFADAVDC